MIKSKIINWKGVLISLSALILTVGTFNYAMGNIVFPNTFTNGTVADATQVNANFTAINTRQSATAALIAGTWNYVESGSAGSSASGYATICSITGGGTLTLSTNGSVSSTEQGLIFCPGSAPTAFNNGTVTGTYSVNADGSGTINITGGGIISFQASKDLNQAFFVTASAAASGTIIISSGTASRQ
jgi:hypothetical protein